jgi:hypothetical protein
MQTAECRITAEFRNTADAELPQNAELFQIASESLQTLSAIGGY